MKNFANIAAQRQRGLEAMSLAALLENNFHAEHWAEALVSTGEAFEQDNAKLKRDLHNARQGCKRLCGLLTTEQSQANELRVQNAKERVILRNLRCLLSEIRIAVTRGRKLERAFIVNACVLAESGERIAEFLPPEQAKKKNRAKALRPAGNKKK